MNNKMVLWHKLLFKHNKNKINRTYIKAPKAQFGHNTNNLNNCLIKHKL